MPASEDAPTKTSGPTILLAPAAGGKTAYLIQRLVGDRTEIRPRWAVLPDRTQVASFRRRISAAGGALGVSVGTFGDLFQEILARAGRPVAVTPAPARQRLLRLALRRLEAGGRLPYTQPIARTPGFLQVVGEAVAELKRARVEPEGLVEWAQLREAANSSVLTELGRIYAEYQSRLAAIPWTDREGLNQLAIAALRDRPDLLSDMPLIAVDGFDSFEAAQLAALSALSGAVARLILTLPGSAAMERAAYRRFAPSLELLRQALPEAEVLELASPEPARLEAALFDREAEAFDPEGAVEMIEARSPTDEAREALRWIKARLVRDGLALEDCALIAPDPEGYGPALRRAGAEFGVRLRFTHGEPLIRAPAVAALLDLLELSRSNWPRRLVLQAVRSPYFDLSAWGFQPGDALALDAASHAGQVVEGIDQWEQALTQLARAEAPPDRHRLEEDLPVFSPPIGAAAGRLLEALKALAQRLTPGESRTTAGWVEWLENLLDELAYPERVEAGGQAGAPVEADRERPAFEHLRETLRALVLGEVVAGSLPFSFAEFLDELRGAVEAAAYRDRLSSVPAVTVLGLLEARGGRYRAVAVLGLSEGVLPVVEREDPFLDERTRQALGLQPRLGREQPGLFYQAVTRADARLLLTRPYLADDGEAWEASPFWREVERLLTRPARRVRPEDARPLQEAGSPGELLFWGVRRGGMPASLLEAQRQRWSQLQHSRDVLAARAAPEPQGPFEGDLAAWSGVLRRRFDAEHRWSPSRLETYGNCPHMFFASHLLQLEPREPPEPGLDAAQLGSILHEILEAAYRAADRPEDPASVRQALDRVVEPLLDRAPQRHGFRPTPLWEIERAQYVEALRETIQALAGQGGEWTPIGLELEFGIDEQPPLELELPPTELGAAQGAGRDDASGEGESPGGAAERAAGRTVRLRGLIDRLDRRPDGGLRVIDYKTGSSRLGVAELNQGRRIQLPLYALAAQEALRLGQVVDGFYWAILAAERGSLRLSNYRSPEPDGPGQVGPPAAYAVTRQHVARYVDGVRFGRFPPIPPPGGCPEYCPAAAWCWRYQPAGWG